jgi:hypothetical protein
MRNTADVTGGKPIAVLLQSISGVSAINPLVAFYDIHGGKREVLFFYFVPDTTRDDKNNIHKEKTKSRPPSLSTDDVPSKRKFQQPADQYAVDDHGRRRFHGAFTGGFSAGFGNTVGTPEGWTPSSFKSSRKDKALISVSCYINLSL